MITFHLQKATKLFQNSLCLFLMLANYDILVSLINTLDAVSVVQ